MCVSDLALFAGVAEAPGQSVGHGFWARLMVLFLLLPFSGTVLSCSLQAVTTSAQTLLHDIVLLSVHFRWRWKP